LAEKLCKTTWIGEIDAAVPVPINNETRNTRGYNQTQYIADAIGEICDIIIYNQILVKKEGMKDQTALSSEERFQNTKNAFFINDATPVIGKSILIIDDVITTGATIHSISNVLIDAGANKVYFAAIASAVH
jgi:ComF family protein